MASGEALGRAVEAVWVALGQAQALVVIAYALIVGIGCRTRRAHLAIKSHVPSVAP